MAKLTNRKIVDQFTQLINASPINSTITWTQLGDTVRAEVKEGGWMQVRDVLQNFINEGILKRTTNLYVEHYIVVEHV
jgi:hypothetical protein